MFVLAYRMHSPVMMDLKTFLRWLEEKWRYWYKFCSFWYVLMSRRWLVASSGPLYMVRSRKLMVVEDDVMVNFMLGWNLLSDSVN